MSLMRRKVGRIAELGSVFQSPAPIRMKRRLQTDSPNAQPLVHISPMWAGFACVCTARTVTVGISICDATYCVDYISHSYPRNLLYGSSETISTVIENYLVYTLSTFSRDHRCKFVGAGINRALLKEAPNLCTRLWLELDIVPIVFETNPIKEESSGVDSHHLAPPAISTASSATSSAPDSAVESDVESEELSRHHLTRFAHVNTGTSFKRFLSLDELADSAVRKCVLYFGPGNNPRLWVGHMNQVHVDAGGKIHLIDDLRRYETTVKEATWHCLTRYAEEVKKRGIKIGFFSSTPQGGGVSLMRHALVRFLTALGVTCEWYVAKPSPTVFRITKNNHNILQGVSHPNLRVTSKERQLFDIWVQKNGAVWMSNGGPLSKDGIDIAIIDDHQMVGLIPLIKKNRPFVPVIYRSHIHIRSDLIDVPGSPQAEVWTHLYSNIKEADIFISHPIPSFIPHDIPRSKVALLPATTDLLDGLNKPLSTWDSQYYMGMFRDLCLQNHMQTLAWPAREYFIQIARFDPAKGLPNAVDAYCRFRQMLTINAGKVSKADTEPPQLVLCGHGAIDDPDAAEVFNQVSVLLETEEYRPYLKDIVIVALPPSDQLLNALLSNSKIVLQLSLSEGFEVKVSEASHASKPVVAFDTGGIPLQIQHGLNGFLVDTGDNETVARHLLELHLDEGKYTCMSDYAKEHVPDEVSTVGNAAAWLYLSVRCMDAGEFKTSGAWLNDLLREEVEPYEEGEPRLSRSAMS